MVIARISVGTMSRNILIVTGLEILSAGPFAAELAEQQLRVEAGRFLERGTGILNTNDFLRVGWGWSQEVGREVFRIGIGSNRLPFHGHLDLW